MKLFLLLSICAFVANGDIYMHNLRGSNNRLKSSGSQVSNANRLFDSQNNANGGYNVGEATDNRLVFNIIILFYYFFK